MPVLSIFFGPTLGRSVFKYRNDGVGVNIIAIETSAETASVALWRDGAVAVRRGGPAGTHSAHVLPWVGELLAEAQLTLRGLDAVAFGSGPGAFTGLRLAVSVAQGLALGAELALIGVPSLEAMALASGTGEVYCCVDARMNEVYCAAYRVGEDDVRTLIEPCVRAPTLVPAAQPGWRGLGNGFAVWHAELEPLRVQLLTCDAGAVPDAAAVAALAALRLSRGDSLDAAHAAPLYVRDKVALTTAERLAAGGRA